MVSRGTRAHLLGRVFTNSPETLRQLCPIWITSCNGSTLISRFVAVRYKYKV